MFVKDKVVVCDIETDGLDYTKVFCIVAIDYNTSEEYVFTPDNMHEFVSFSKTVRRWIGHNFLAFDAPALNQLLEGVQIPWQDVTDTLVLSRLFNVNRLKHSMEYWGETYFKIPKVAHEDWSKFSLEMLHRCRTDVLLNIKMYDYLKREGAGFSKECIDLEHAVAYILDQQRRAGCLINWDSALRIKDKCDSEMSSIMRRVEEEIPPFVKYLRTIKIVKTKSGGIPKRIENALNKYYKANGERFTAKDKEFLYKYGKEVDVYVVTPFNPKSPKQVVERLNEVGWNPVLFTKKGTPKVCEENLQTIVDTAPEIYRSFARYAMLKSRSDVVQGWLDARGDDDRCHGTVIGVGAKTHRMAHRYPNTANIPSGRGEFGKELRQCWTTDLTKNMFQGTDAMGIQLRVLGCYMGDEAYVEAVQTDPHSYNANILGVSRDVAKTFIYAYLLNASAGKLGEIIGGNASQGKAARDRFEAGLPALKRLRKRCTREAKRGYHVGLDGRRIPIESDHYSLAVFLQGGEAVIMKKALTLWWFKAKQLGLDFNLVANAHDEWQVEVSKEHIEDIKTVTWTKEEIEANMPEEYPEDDYDKVFNKTLKRLAEEYVPKLEKETGRIYSKGKLKKDLTYEYILSTLGEMEVKAIREAGEHFNFACPMNGEYIMGENWYDTH